MAASRGGGWRRRAGGRSDRTDRRRRIEFNIGLQPSAAGEKISAAAAEAGRYAERI
jgi:hypothetical protein